MSFTRSPEALKKMPEGENDKDGISRELSEKAVIRLTPESLEVDPVGVLRSRVEQQSTLIAMLKRRADETLKELEHCRRRFEAAVARNDELERKLEGQTRQRVLIDQRFGELAENHNEMIKIKDEYKDSNRILQLENDRLRRENEMKFSAAVKEREMQLFQLQEEISRRSKKEKTLEKRCLQLEARVKNVEGNLEEEEDRFRKNLATSEARLLASREPLPILAASQEAEKELHELLERKVTEIGAVRQRNKELVDTCRAREKDAQLKEASVAELQMRLSQSELENQQLRVEFRTRSEEVSRDVQVAKLRLELQTSQDKTNSVEREFSAYKKHSTELLKQERELNSKLRHLLE